ncbi:MAG: ATP-grasp domain-containing protein [Candidatus Omnitrophota bacterium]
MKSDHAPVQGLPADFYAELDREETIDEVTAALESAGHKVVRIGNARKLLERIQDVGAMDIVLNICEGIGNRNRESQVPAILDLYGIPYVGSDALTLGLSLDKALAKKIFLADGVLTPRFFVADAGTDFGNLDSMKFPFFVKPVHEGSSKGISDKSIVSDTTALKQQVEEILRLYKQPALVEEFIRGGEFTVLVIGNEKPWALAPVQIQIAGNLEAGNLVYTSRRLEGDDIVYVCPPKISPDLDKKLRDLAVKAYRSMGCLDFGRVDFRVDERGCPFVLEVNPLPAVTISDVFPLAAEAEGISYNDLMVRIIDEALKRTGKA